jgi:hypothetical protein
MPPLSTFSGQTILTRAILSIHTSRQHTISKRNHIADRLCSLTRAELPTGAAHQHGPGQKLSPCWDCGATLQTGDKRRAQGGHTPVVDRSPPYARMQRKSTLGRATGVARITTKKACEHITPVHLRSYEKELQSIHHNK